MRIKDGFVKREIMGETVIVPTGEAGKSVRGVIKLNDTARIIWDTLESGKTIEDAADALVKAYDVDRERALQDVQKIVESMKEADVFTE